MRTFFRGSAMRCLSLASVVAMAAAVSSRPALRTLKPAVQRTRQPLAYYQHVEYQQPPQLAVQSPFVDRAQHFANEDALDTARSWTHPTSNALLAARYDQYGQQPHNQYRQAAPYYDAHPHVQQQQPQHWQPAMDADATRDEAPEAPQFHQSTTTSMIDQGWYHEPTKGWSCWE